MPQSTASNPGHIPLNIPTPKEVFQYRSTIRLITETATFEFNPAIPPDERRAILLKDPGWRIAWPPPLTGFADRDDLILAFSRIIASLGLRAGIPGSTAAAVKSGLFEMFDSLPRAMNTKAEAASYRRFAVEASIDDHGAASWGYFEDRDGLTLPGVDDRLHHLGKTGVEIFVQNLLRIALLERLEDLQSPAK